ncbi:MAG: DUF4058 family protein [Pirellulaceae bacterium]
MLKSPFPGMDPYLEQDWLDVHASLVTYIRDQIQDQLPPALCARMESRVLVESDGDADERHQYPDVRVIDVGGSSSSTAVLELPRQSTVEPDLLLVEARGEPATQRFIQIVDSPTRSRVVTTIELISPTNKRPGAGQRLYQVKRDECLAAEVNFVEIDLTRSGDRLSLLPELGRVHPPPTYVGCVRRAQRPDQIAVYLMPLDQPLKPMRIPLRATDEDIVLHMQPLVAQAYDRGRYGNLDYTRPLNPPLTPAEAEFAERVLKESGKR